MHTAHAPIASPSRRALAGAAAAILLATIVVVLARTGEGWWQLFVFGAGPDVALFLGVGRGLQPGQLHPRAVPLYNLLHRVWGPLLLGLAAATGLLGTGFLVGALAWGLHVAIDRAVGYGLRTPDGFQRG
jgi:hypothetical protein